MRLIVDAYFDAEKAFWDLFGLAPLYALTDFRAHPWARNGDEIQVCLPGKHPETDDDMYEECEYSGELYGTSLWKRDDLTLVAVFNNGEKEAWLLSTDFEVKNA